MKQRKTALYVWGILVLCLVSTGVQGRNADLSNWMVNLSGDEPEGGITEDHNAEIAVDGNFVHVVWTARSADWSNNYLFYRRSTDGGVTWDDTVTLEVIPYQSGYENSCFRRLAVSGQYVHVISTLSPSKWHYELVYYRSDDYGTTFDDAETLFSGAEAYKITDIMISGDGSGMSIGFIYYPNWYDAYVIYTLDSGDNGATFAQHTVATSGDRSGHLSDLLRWGDNVYVLYYHLIENFYYGHWQAAIHFAGSTDGGQTYSSAHTFTTAASNGEYLTYRLSDSNNTPNLAASGDNVYVLWSQNDTAYDSDDRAVYFSRSTDNGASFSAPFLVTNYASLGEQLQVGQETIAALGSNVYIAVLAESGRLYRRCSTNSGSSFQSLLEVTAGDNSPRISTCWWPVIAPNAFGVGRNNVSFFFTAPGYRYSTDAGATLGGATLLGPAFSWRKADRPDAVFGSGGAMHYVVEGYDTYYSTGVFGDSDIFYQRVEPWNAPEAGGENKAMMFATVENPGDGSGMEQFDCMEVPANDAINFTSAMSIEAWVKPDRSVSEESYFIFKADPGAAPSWGSYLLGQRSDDRLEARIATTDGGFVLGGGEPLPNGEWSHVAMTYDAGAKADNLKIYVNGDLAGTATATGYLATGNGILFIGGYSSYRYHDGITIDELRFWNRALTGDEIRQNLGAPLVGSESGLTAYYTFDDTVKDISAHGNNGQLTYKEIFTGGFVLERGIFGHVTFERPGVSAPDPSFSVPVTITLCDEKGVVAEYSVVTDENGDYSLEIDEHGVFDMTAKGGHTLAAKQSGVEIPFNGIVPVDFPTLLEGDANGDNAVTATDFFLLRGAYNTSAGDPDFDENADFNEDDLVNASDFFLLRANYNVEGEDCSSR